MNDTIQISEEENEKYLAFLKKLEKVCFFFFFTYFSINFFFAAKTRITKIKT